MRLHVQRKTARRIPGRSGNQRIARTKTKNSMYEKHFQRTSLVVCPAYQHQNGEKFQNLAGKNVLIVDEDINVGLVMMACIKTIINQKVKSISVATPILSTASIKAIDSITDDLYYIKNSSLLLDLKIVIKTIIIILKRNSL